MILSLKAFGIFGLYKACVSETGLLNSPLFALPTSRSVTMSAFSYSKLPKETDIRVLVIQPGAVDAPIQANLRVWDGIEPYEALSWSWGALSPSISIQIINENGHREPLLIKSN